MATIPVARVSSEIENCKERDRLRIAEEASLSPAERVLLRQQRLKTAQSLRTLAKTSSDQLKPQKSSGTIKLVDKREFAQPLGLRPGKRVSTDWSWGQLSRTGPQAVQSTLAFKCPTSTCSSS